MPAASGVLVDRESRLRKDDRGDHVVPTFEERPNVRDRRTIEPGRPRLEHVVFVLLGVVLTILTFLRGLNLV